MKPRRGLPDTKPPTGATKRRWPPRGGLPNTTAYGRRSLLARLGETQLTPGVVALVFAAVMVSALTTEWIGIHTIFGAFLLGAIIPHDSVVARAFPKKMGELATVLLLPAFFAFTGMHTRIGLVSGLEHWLICRADHRGRYGGQVRRDPAGGPVHHRPLRRSYSGSLQVHLPLLMPGSCGTENGRSTMHLVPLHEGQRSSRPPAWTGLTSWRPG